jgi:hypothetical protein
MQVIESRFNMLDDEFHPKSEGFLCLHIFTETP